MLYSLSSISFYRQQLENAYLFDTVHSSSLLTMSQNLDRMILHAQRMRYANFARTNMRGMRRRVSRAIL